MALARRLELKDPRGVVMILRKQEAETLLKILRSVGGFPEEYPRRAVNGIVDALVDAGVTGKTKIQVTGALTVRDLAHKREG